MPLPSVQHIRDISFQDHFLSAQGAAPKNGKIQVNHNTFDVTFVDGRVNAKFASGNWFTNLFRSSTLTRFTQTLQAQYDAWVNNQAKAGGGDGVPGGVVNDIVVNDNVQEPPVMANLQNDPNIVDENAGIDEGVKDNPNVAANNKAQGVPAAKGFQNNPNVAAVNTAIDGIIDVLAANSEKIDKDGIRYPKTVMKAFAMPDTADSLSEDDAAKFIRATEGNGMPPNMARLLSKLGEIGKLAALRNQLTNVPSGTECDEIVRNAGFLTHTLENNIGKSEQEIKHYVLNMLDTVIDGFLNAVNVMTDKNTQALDFLRKFDGACVEAKGDNIQEYVGRAMNIVTAGRSEEKHDLAYSVTAEFNALADEVSEKYQCDVAVAFVPDLGGKYVVDYADDFYDYKGYGYGPNDDGILLLVSVGDREFAETTYGYGKTAFTDYGMSHYLEPRFTPWLGENDWAGAAEQFITDAGVLLKQARDGNPYDYSAPQREQKSFKETAPLAALISAVIGFFSGGIPTGAMKRQMKSVEKEYGAANYARGGLNLRARDDRFLYANVSKTRIQRDTEHRSGGGGGGSSVHFSSSGRSHGGSHGKF